MNRQSVFYRFLKRCETPKPGSGFWLILNLLYNVFMVCLGRVLYKATKSIKVEANYIFLPTFSKGDILILYRSMSILNKTNGFETSVLIVEEKLCSLAKRMMDCKCVALPAWKIVPLSKAILFDKEKHTNIAIASPWLLFDTRNLNTSLLRTFPCKLSEDVKRRIFPKRIMLRKSVVLSPYEQSFAGFGEKALPISFWKSLSEKLKDGGFFVFTNCDGTVETPIEGTMIFYPPMDEIAGAVEYAGYSVSVRSGFSDWCSGAKKAKLVVLYPSASFYERFRLDAVWGMTDVFEEVYKLRSDELERLADRIIDYFKN